MFTAVCSGLVHTLCVNWAVLHVPRHGDATRVRCATCFPECLSIPQVPFPVPGAPSCCICLCKSSRNLQPALPIPAMHPGTVSGARAHTVKMALREMPIASGALVGRFVACACCHQEGGQTRDTPLPPKTSRLIRGLWSEEKPAGGSFAVRVGWFQELYFLKIV